MITISLDKPSYAPGDTVRATITLRLGKPVRARALVANLSCSEQKQVKTNVVLDKYEYDRDREMSVPYASHMETRTEIRAKNWFSQERKISGGDEYASGEFNAEFVLPKNAPPTSHEFGHDDLIHIWKVAAKLDIPFAIDENGEIELMVDGL